MAIQDEIPKSRLTLKYKTEINGEKEDVNLPLRFLVMGDFSNGKSKDRQVDLDERRMRSLDGKNLNGIIKDMGINLDVVVDNKIDPDTGGEDLEISLPITSMKSFNPEEISTQVPKIKGLILVKKLLQEIIANMDNKKEFRNLLNNLVSNPEALEKVIAELDAYSGLKIPSKSK
jgi:type VI secretion system protein ImpB